MPRDPQYMTLAASSKLMIWAFLAVFVGYSPRFLGPGRISMPRDPRYMTRAASSKLVILGISCRFHGLVHGFWVPAVFRCPVTPGT